MTIPKPADVQRSEFTRHFKARLPFLRHDTLQCVVDIIFAMVTARSVNQSDPCPHLPAASSIEAKRRRLERGCREPQLTESIFLAFLLALLPADKLLPSIDRTFLVRTSPMRTLARTWESGDVPLNFLVPGVVLHGYTVPFMWSILPHQGSSSTAARILLVARLLKVLPARCWAVLIADREFVGQEWCSFLRRKRIRQCLRIRENTRIEYDLARDLFTTLKPGEVRTLFERTRVYGG